MVTIRTAKNKGSAFEYDVHASLQQAYPNIYLTKQLGFQQQYDLRDDHVQVVVECKRHAKFSWKELMKYYLKLIEAAPDGYKSYVIFRPNQQPALVFGPDELQCLSIRLFEDVFGVKFRKHESTRKKKDGDEKNEKINDNGDI